MGKLHIATIGLVFVAGSAAIAAPSTPLHYPQAQSGKTVDNYFGTQVPAPYQWMENLDSPALKQWVAAENELTDAYLAKIPVRGWIQKRLTTLWNYAKEGTPIQT
ncbi:MAG: S9 family peptidase, partial [Terriglobia bacterium]